MWDASLRYETQSDTVAADEGTRRATLALATSPQRPFQAEPELGSGRQRCSLRPPSQCSFQAGGGRIDNRFMAIAASSSAPRPSRPAWTRGWRP